jgi:tRNA(Arg) A34 adenosine deaminase TadA
VLAKLVIDFSELLRYDVNMNANTLTKLIEKSRQLLELVPDQKFWHFSFIVERNKVLSFGWNKMSKTHPYALRHGYKFGFLHSEVDAVKNFPGTPAELSHCSLVNIRISKQGKVVLSKPCPCCTKLLIGLDFKEVLYSQDDGSFEELW